MPARPFRLLALFLALTLGLGLWPGRAQALMTLEEERKLGKEAFEEVKAQITFVSDPDVVAYVRGLGQRLAAEIPDSPFTFQFYVADSPEVNAFAMPGGYVVFFRGMIMTVESEAELAGVMGHEISHVSHRHLAHRVEKATPVGIASLAGALAGMVLAATGVGALGTALMMGSIGAGVQTMLSFSREDEAEADFAGYQLLTGLGYPGTAMAQSFKRIWAIERMMGPDVPNYLRSHPASPERMERIEDMARRNPRPVKPYDNGEFLRIKTRLEALYTPQDQAYQSFTRQRGERPQDPLPIYGLSLVYLRTGRLDLARKYLAMLEGMWDKKPLVWREQAKCSLLAGDFRQAQDLLTKVLIYRPTDQEALTEMAQAQQNTGSLAEASQTLTKLTALDPDNDQALYDLGVVLGRQGRLGESSFYLGQAFAKRGNERTARFHLTKAVKELAGQPELMKQAQEDLDKLDEKTKEKEKKQKEEERKRREEQQRKDDEDRRRSTIPPWNPDRP